MAIVNNLGESAAAGLSLLTQAIASFGLCSLSQDASALRDPARASQLAGHLGLSAGHVLDLSVNNPSTDLPWDFSQSSSREHALRILREERPALLLGSPECPAASLLQQGCADTATCCRLLAQCKAHLQFLVSLYRMQQAANRLWLHGHGAGASSWLLSEVADLIHSPGVYMCTPAVREVTWATNSPCIASALERPMRGRVSARAGRRIRPAYLAARILEGLRDQLVLNGHMYSGSLGSVCCETVEHTDWSVVNESAPVKWDRGQTVYYDDISGELLDSPLVEKAIAEEMATYASHGVYRKVPIAEAWSTCGKAPIKVRWVICNKGDKESPDYRARLVAKEIKTDQRLDLFAATPPLEAKKFLFSLAMSRRHSSGSVLKVQFIDIKRAYFHAKAVRDVFVDLPEQDAEEGMCGKLVYAMYGTRDAAQNWEREYESAFLALGFTQGLSSPCVFYHAERDIRTVVHGDDFTSISDDVQLKWLAAELRKRYELKLRATLGPEPQDDTTVRILPHSLLGGSRHYLRA